jgi:hypothetical protein
MLEGSNEERAMWIEEFTSYVVTQRPRAVRALVDSAAADLHARVGSFDPIDVAEAEWHEMDLGDQ